MLCDQKQRHTMQTAIHNLTCILAGGGLPRGEEILLDAAVCMAAAGLMVDVTICKSIGEHWGLKHRT